MTRSHRSLHRLIWIALALVLGIAFTLAVFLRPPPAHGTPIAVQEFHQ